MSGTLTGSITLKRLKKGVNVILSIKTENAALYQGWNDKLGAAVPSFKTEANRPVLVPTAVATNNGTASINTGYWSYNGTLLTATSEELSDGFYKCSDSRFAINTSNYKLKIIDDVASANNVSNDIFTFNCSGEAAGASFESSGTIELHLQVVGSSAAAVYIEGGCTLSSSNPSETLKAHFFIDGVEITSGYTFVWKNEGGGNIGGANGNTCVVSRDDVTAIGGVYCSVYKQGDTTSALATDFHKMTDISDEMELGVTCDRDYYYNEATGEEHIQTVTAHLYKFENGEIKDEISNADGTFTHTFKSSSSNTTLGTLEGKVVKVGKDIWGTVYNKNEDVNDFLTYSY